MSNRGGVVINYWFISNRGGVVINYWFITVKQCKIIKQRKNRAHKVVYLNTNDGSSDLEWAAWFS
jgi:hypothetical protein